MEQAILLKMLNQAQYELMTYPHMRAGYYLLRPFRTVFGVPYKHRDRMAFPNALLAKALMEFYQKNVNTEEGREVFELLKRYYDRWIFSGCKIRSIEDAYAGMALIDLHKITGSEKYKTAADKLAAYLMSRETDDTGSILTYPKKGEGYVYADTIGLICPFLAKYGKTYEDMNTLNLAVTQIQNYMSFGMDNKLILPYHGYEYESGLKYGITGWGLAVGRLMMGMSETLYYMTPDRLGYEDTRQAYRRIVDKVEAYQLQGGLYSWQLLAKDG
nr:glycoside hydrolase family 88 protein [Lachnospiraceae bacterium]